MSEMLPYDRCNRAADSRPGIIRNGLLACGLCLLFLSCATTKPAAFLDIDIAVYGGNFEEGIEAMQERQEAKKPLYPESNAISLFLDKGMLEHYAGNYEESAQNLQEAERLIEEAHTKSVSAAVASYIANDNTKDYAGEDFEDIYINVFNALNYYKQDDIDGALVEIRKLTLSSGKLDIISRRYEESGRSVGDWVMEQLSKIGFSLSASLPQGEPMTYSGSALAQYLGALFFLADGNEDSAHIAFNAVEEAFAANPAIYGYPVPKAVAEARDVPEGMARLNVIAFAGLSPVKEEGKFSQAWIFMQNPELKNPVFKLPVFVDRDTGDYRVSVTVNGETFDLELIEDMGAVAKETYNAKFANLFLKTYIRVLLKYAAADIAATAASQAGKYGDIARFAAANAARVAINLSESADIRMGRYLPNKAFIGGINLEPGSYPVIIEFSTGYRKELTAEVKPGEINLIDAVSLTPNDMTVALMASAGAGGGGSSGRGGAGSSSRWVPAPGDDDYHHLGMYFDAGFMGATYFTTGIGLSLYNDVVKFQVQYGLAPPENNDYTTDGGRYVGHVIGIKLLANFFTLPFERLFGPSWGFYTMNFAVGANFSWFSMDDGLWGGNRHRDPLFMGAVLGQWEIIKADMSYFFPNWQYFKSLSLYAEPQIWFASSDINTETIIKLSYGVRVSMF